MTRNGLKVALQHAETLPSFSSIEDAKQSLFQLRNQSCDQLLRLSKSKGVQLDFSPNSLKDLESWYFDLSSSDAFSALDITRERFERCMGFYVGFVYTNNDSDFQWIVEERPFISGRFQIGVNRGPFTLMIGRVLDLHMLKSNKRMQSIYREYRQYSSPQVFKKPKRKIKGRKGNEPCPDCGEPLRTNHAKQCFECGASWRSDGPA